MPDLEKLLNTQPSVGDLTDAVVRMDNEIQILRDELRHYAWHASRHDPPMPFESHDILARNEFGRIDIATPEMVRVFPERFPRWARIRPDLWR